MKKMQVFGLAMVLGVLVFAGCEDQQDDSVVPLDKEVSVRIDRKHTVYPNLSFEVDEVNDSRCPRGVVCIWQGEAVVWVRVFESTQIQAAEAERLRLSTHESRSQTYDGYRFELIDVEPYPDIEEEYNKEDIRVVLKITRDQ